MFKIKKILPSLTLVVLLFGWLIMSTTQTASAADPAAITADGSQINYQGATYTNSGLTDTNNQPLFVASDFQCGGKLIVASTNNSYTLITSAGSGGLGSGCTLTTGGEVTLDVYKVETQDDCEGIGADWQSNKCTFNDSTDATSFAASASGEGGNLTNGEGSCEDEGGEFSFFLCPALRIATDMFEELDYQIRSALEVKPKYYQDSQLKQAWARIRNVAYVLLIPVMLFMVIGTALGFNFLDAYTVKRALPRMFAAIIFMALSYDVCRIMIDITNGVGRGAGGLIAQPFGGLDSLRLQDIFNAGAVNGASALGGGALGVVVLFAIGALSLGILASYFFTASLALLVVFIVLSVRELIIVFLIILAPLAILAWIFPGNDKMWKLWWGTFTKLLFLYPLIVGLLVTGRAFAKIAGTLGATGIEGVFIILVKLTAYVGPFFFIPKAFQYAGSAFGNLAGMVNDRGKGLFDRNRKYRSDKMKKNREKREEQGLLRPSGRLANTKLGSGINNLGAKGFALKNAAARDGLRGLSRAGIKDSLDRKRIHEQGLAAKDEVLATKGLNDNFLHMLEGIMKGTKDQELIDDLVANGYNDEQARIALVQGKNMYDHYGHGLAKIISDGKAASKTSQTADFSEFLRDVITLSHGDDESMMMELLGSGKGAFAQAGRLSMSGGSYGEQAAMMKAMANVRPDGTYSGPSQLSYFDEITGRNETIDMSGITTGDQVADMVNRRQRQKARDSFGTWDWSRVHPTDVKSLMTDLHSGVNETAAQLRDRSLPESERLEKQRLLGQQIGQLQSLRANAMQSGNDEVQRIVADAFDMKTPIDVGIDGTQFSSISHLLEDTQGRASGQGVTRGNGEFARVEQLATFEPEILAGYRSVSKTGNMSAEQMEQLRQANTPK